MEIEQFTINIHVIQSNITATSTSVTGYVGGVNQTVTIQGTDIGTLSIETPPTENSCNSKPTRKYINNKTSRRWKNKCNSKRGKWK